MPFNNVFASGRRAEASKINQISLIKGRINDVAYPSNVSKEILRRIILSTS